MLPSLLGTVLSLFGGLHLPQFPFKSHPTTTATPPSPLAFQLRHVHGVSNESTVVFQDVPDAIATESIHSVNTRRMRVHRPRSTASFHRARLRSRIERVIEPLDWDEDDVVGPDPADREALLELAKMTNNAYLDIGEAGWYNLTDQWKNEVSRSAILMLIQTYVAGYRAIPLVGNQTQTDSEAMFLCPPTSPPSSSPSKGLRLAYSVEEVPRSERTSRTTICSSRAVARGWTGRGTPFATATEAAGSAIKTVWRRV